MTFIGFPPGAEDRFIAQTFLPNAVREGLPKIKVNEAPQIVFKMPVPVHVTFHEMAEGSAHRIWSTASSTCTTIRPA